MFCKPAFAIIAAVAVVAADPNGPPKEIEKQFGEFLARRDKRYDEPEYVLKKPRSRSLRGLSIMTEPTTYVKAGRGKQAVCPAGDQVVSVDECRNAGEILGFPFRHSEFITGGRPGGCYWDQNGLSYFNTNLESTATWTGVGAICRGVYEKSAMMEPTTYVKAGSGKQAVCPAGDQVVSVDECRNAGEILGFPFRHSEFISSGRPGGCYWDQNGLSYFNTNLESTATWTGVGAICRGTHESSEPCSDNLIRSAGECEIAGTAVGYPFSVIPPTPDFESRPPNGQCIYDDTLPGAALGGNAHTVIMSLTFYDRPFNKRQWIFNLGQTSGGAEHWLWNNGDDIQFGMWNGKASNQIRKGDISSARTLATVFDGSQYTLYVDGVRVASQTISLNITSGAMALGSALLNEDQFKGCIYGVNVYRSALSDKQVQAAAKILQNTPVDGEPVQGPGGCFWNQNGDSYFNPDLQSMFAPNGVGRICRALRTEVTSGDR